MNPTAQAVTLFPIVDELINVNDDYFVSHLITYIGNKRRLLPFLNSVFCQIKHELNINTLRTLDGFAGSGAVSRLLKYHSSHLISNDFEGYTKTINSAYLANRETIDLVRLQAAINFLNAHKTDAVASDYFISNNYAPNDDNDIQSGERVFYTKRNAHIIDTVRFLIDSEIDEDIRLYCLANLLIKASIHTNTSGVFKGFHKKDGLGHFGGRGENALSRIMTDIVLETPLFSSVSCDVEIYQEDINRLVYTLEPVDLAYFDPPYNQHPYGSNYFMLNLINDGRPAAIQSGISGITQDWKRSAYNKRQAAIVAMSDLVARTKATFIAISYNDEGLIPLNAFETLLKQYGEVRSFEKEYATYRGSRNLGGRDQTVKEILWVLKKR